MPGNFLVLGLPRSRTAWLAKFLSYGDWRCGHEELRHARSFEDIEAWFSQPFTGSAETAACQWWRLIPDDVRIVVVRRDPGEVIESLLSLSSVKFDRAATERMVKHLDRKLDQIEVRRDCLSVRFQDLNDDATCAMVFEHCLQQPFDGAWWDLWAPVNVQCDMVAMTRYAQANSAAMVRFSGIAKQRVLTSLSRKMNADPEGITFQTEAFDDWLRDGAALFDEHLALVGEMPGTSSAKNIPMMRRIYDAGAMQIMTARCNGRMFGYLMTLISPSLGAENLTHATNTTFYASPEFPGLGMKIQRAAIRELKARGVDSLFFEAGKRGSGPRLDTMYRRLGAEEYGKVLHLPLKAA